MWIWSQSPVYCWPPNLWVPPLQILEQPYQHEKLWILISVEDNCMVTYIKSVLGLLHLGTLWSWLCCLSLAAISLMVVKYTWHKLTILMILSIQQGKGGWKVEKATLTCIHCQVWNRQLMESCCISWGAQSDALWWSRGVGWGMGGKVKRERNTYIVTADSYCCVAETNTTL